MIVLEALYDAVEARLRPEYRDWDGFADDFASAFDSDFLLYRVSLAPDTLKPVDFVAIATSNKQVVDDYIDNRIYEYNVIPESRLASLEPIRRRDVLPDDQYRQIGPLFDFFNPRGIFHSLFVPAALSDGTFAGLFVWRPETATDFSSLEKQRLALFMRHLMAFIDETELNVNKPVRGLDDFCRHWNLTDTESDILGDLIRGRSLRQIAADGQRGYGTIRWHVQNILEKCNVNSQKELLREFYTLIS